MIRTVFLLLAGGLATAAAPAEPARTLTLAEAERLMIQNNPDLAIGRASLAGAEAGIASADVRPNPQLSLSVGSISLQQGVGGGSLSDKRMDSVLRVDQTVERGDKRALRVAAATANAQAAREDLAALLRQQRMTLASAYYDLLAAQRRLAIVDEIAGFARRSVEVAQRRLAAGDLARADLARARADAARAAGDLDLARAERRHAQLALAQLIGIAGNSPELSTEDEWPPLESPGGAPTAELVAARPDVSAAYARVEAARRARDLARAQRTRDVSLGLQVEHDPYTAPGTLLGASVSIPLFLGNDYHGDIAKAEADYTQALESARKVELAAAAELERQRFDVQALAERARRLREELLPEARRAAAAAEFAFGQGAMGIGDVLDARRSLKAAEQDVIASLTEHAKALHAWRVQQETE